MSGLVTLEYGLYSEGMAKNKDTAPTTAQTLEAGILALTNKAHREGKLYETVERLPRDHQRTVLDVIGRADREGR